MVVIYIYISDTTEEVFLWLLFLVCVILSYFIFTFSEGVKGIYCKGQTFTVIVTLRQVRFEPHQDLAEGFVLHVGQVLGQGRGVQMVKQQRGFTLLLYTRSHLPLPLIWWAEASNKLCALANSYAQACGYHRALTIKLITKNRQSNKKKWHMVRHELVHWIVYSMVLSREA